MTILRLLLLLGAPVVRRIEPGAPVARSERLKHPLDLLPGRRAADQAIRGDPLLDLEGRAVLTAVHVHGHGQRLRSETGPAPQSIPFASRVRCLVALGAGRRGTALGPGLLAVGPASNSTLLSIEPARATFAARSRGR